MKVETVEVNGVIVNKGDEESAAKFAKNKKAEEAAEASEEVAPEESPKGKKGK